MRDGPEKHSVDRPKSAWTLWKERTGPLFFFLVFFYCVVLLVWFFTDRSADRFERDGRVTVAVVQGFDQWRSQNSDGEWETNYAMDFLYEANGQVVDRRSVRKTPWGREVGERFEIRYLSDQPEKIEMSVGGTRRSERFFGWALFGLSVVIGTVLLSSGRAVTQAIRARRIGDEVKGRIVEMNKTPDQKKKNGKRVPGTGRIFWMTEDGFSGSHGGIPHYIYGRYSIGDPLRLFRLGRSTWWEGDVGPRRLDESRVPVVPQDE